MVEAVDVSPGFGAVASLAAEGSAVCALAGHLFCELTLVRILVASGASAIVKVERENFVSAPGKANLVAVRTGDRNMCSGERVAGIAVFCDRVSGPVPVGNGVAILTAIFVRLACKLTVMHVFVAIGTRLEFDLIDGVLACGSMALGALDLYVFALEWVL